MSKSSVVRNVDIGVEMPLTDNEIDCNVGRQLRFRRVELGFSQTVVADALGIKFQQIQKYEKGTNRVSASRLWDLADFLKVDIGYFFEGLPGAIEGDVEELGKRSDILLLVKSIELLPAPIRTRLRNLIAEARACCKSD